MQRLFLDCNIYDALARDGETAALVRTALDGGLVKVIVNSVVKNELAASPFNGVPEIFAVELVSDHVAIPGLACPDLCRPGEGIIFREHIGNSHHGADAVNADTAHCEADVFVSDDRRARTRAQAHSGTLTCLTYDEFRRWIREI